MTNMFDYLKWRGDILFSQVPLNKIDALIFAQLSYVNMENLVCSDFSSPITIKQLYQNYINSKDFPTRNTSYYKKKKTTELLAAAASCERYCNVEVCHHIQIIDEQKSEQFKAVTFILPQQTVIAISGTDDTIIGWKEDFMLSFSQNIPSYQDALTYFEKTASYFSAPLILTGHSKGGNICINTAVNCDKKLQKQIQAVYNFDGPGFEKKFFLQDSFKQIEEKVFSFYPSGSIVGMIYYHPKKYEIVKSNGVALNQHKATLWEICGSDFIHEKEFASQSIIFNESLNNWTRHVSEKNRAIIANNLFDIISSSGAKTLTELGHIKIKSLQNMFSTYTNLKNPQSEDLKLFVKIMFEVVQDTSPFGNIIKKGFFKKDT